MWDLTSFGNVLRYHILNGLLPMRSSESSPSSAEFTPLHPRRGAEEP